MTAPLLREAGPDDLEHVERLLTTAGLPTVGLRDAWRTWVADTGDELVGTASLERHGDALLLRSVAVTPGARRDGLGAQLVTTALDAARGLGPVALLTETAARYFPRFGFSTVPRDQLDPALQASSELLGACPATAVAMLRP